MYKCEECPQRCKAQTKKELKKFCVKNVEFNKEYKTLLKKDKFILKER